MQQKIYFTVNDIFFEQYCFLSILLLIKASGMLHSWIHFIVDFLSSFVKHTNLQPI